jgi:isoleucyl-tRNA synthetase
MNLAKMMAPFTPFFTEYMYQNLRLAFPPGHPEREDSVHYLFFPEVRPWREFIPLHDMDTDRSLL